MIQTKIISRTGVVFEGEVAHVTFPGAIGRFSVYPLHAPILSTLKKGTIDCFLSDGKKTVFPIQSGFVEVKNDRATACVEYPIGITYQ